MKKYRNIIVCLIMSLVFIVYIISLSPKKMQNDTFWSIKVGEKLVNEGVWEVDDFSIHEGLHYIAHHFITDILIYFVYSFGGFTALYIMEILMAIIMAGVLYLLNKEISGNKLLSTVMLFLQMFIMAGYIAVRAQMISYILFILELLLLEKYKKRTKTKYIAGLSIIPILLANFHMGTVPFYFVILGVYIISLIRIKIPLFDFTNQTDKYRVKQLLIVAVIGIVTIFINPYFVDGVIYPFKTFGNNFINSTILEFQSYRISFDGGWSLLYMTIVILILIFTKQKIKIGDFLLIFGTLFMGFVAIRYIGLFVICSTVVIKYINTILVTNNLKKEDVMAFKCTAIFLVVTLVSMVFASQISKMPQNYIPEEVYPVKAVEFLKKEITSHDRIFNFYDWGSYLMLNDIKVYMDSRCDLYTKEYSGTDIADDYNKISQCDKNYREIIDKYNINLFIIEVNTKLDVLLAENEDFEKIYEDTLTIIYKHI